MRTDEEIVERIAEIEAQDMDIFGFERIDLISYLPFEKAKSFLKPEAATEADWKPSPRDRDSIVAEMLRYMPFAWEKANGCRGLSAARTLFHYRAWLWMAGDVDFIEELLEYEHYGKEKLVQICELYGWDPKQWDDGRRVNSSEEE